jgi:hypothetical protein
MCPPATPPRPRCPHVSFIGTSASGTEVPGRQCRQPGGIDGIGRAACQLMTHQQHWAVARPGARWAPVDPPLRHEPIET